jgi:superfamily II DNA or RNA helicase
MTPVKIEILDPVNARVTNYHARLILPSLSYEAEYYRPRKIPGTNKVIKQRYTYRKTLLEHWGKEHSVFPAGLADRVWQFCQEKIIDCHMDSVFDYPTPKKPHLRDIVLRKDQVDIIEKVVQHPLGIIKAPTGMGKTVIQLAIASMYKDAPILILANRSDIVNQTVERAKEYGLKGIVQKGGGKQESVKDGATFVIATVQSFAKVMAGRPPTTFFKVVIVDEAHHVSSFDSQYADVLRKILAPVRLGFTATLPEDQEAQFAMEGLIGPVIAEATFTDAVNADVIVRPEIRFLRTNFDHSIRELHKYQDVYEQGIVTNTNRNYLVAETALKHVEKNETVLIFVDKIQHGNYLQEMFEGKVPFVQGAMPPEERMKVKKGLIEKSIFLVIATTAWKEGVDIPNLDVVILAAGGKTEIPVIQSIGRGLRKTASKTKAVIYDIFDPSHYYLVNHFGERISMYFDMGLMGG